MPLEVVVELQIRAVSCPGGFLSGKQDVNLGVYLLNQYLGTNCFPSVFPIMIQQNMRFEKVFENAIDPGAVAGILESFLTRRASSLDSLAANIKVIEEPNEQIVLRNESPSSLDSSKFGKPLPSYSNQGDADFHQGTSFAAFQHSSPASPLRDQPFLRDSFSPSSQSTRKKIHERIASHGGYVRTDTNRVEKDANKAKRKIQKQANRAVPEINNIIEDATEFIKQNIVMSSGSVGGLLLGLAS
ncbi:Spermatogenesis Associated 6-Like Protein [Manis pentadactyla]|nr:Spermatogenesis Associated 6-Like Protein [Manis pentadactyla]